MRENLYGSGLPNAWHTDDGTNNEAIQRLIFVAPHQATYQCLHHATREHFPQAEVFHLDRLPQPGETDSTMDLVLLGALKPLIMPALIEECRRCFPAAAIAVVVDNGQPVIDHSVIDRHLVQGILPTTLPLDVWLAVVQLVLAGGEFLSRDFLAEHRPEALPPMPEMTQQIAPAATAFMARRPGLDDGGEHGLDALTAREREILMLVSEGYQNKLIADRMALSEHTVKAHVHNLIAKLRVTNRTQAAAYLHEHKPDRAPPLDPGSPDRRRAALSG